MPKRVQLPDGNIGEFPDSMSEQQIEGVLQKQFPPKQAAFNPTANLQTNEQARHARQTPMARMFERGAEAVVNQAPAIMSTVGGVGGSLFGPMGAIGGAGVGGAAGEAFKERSQEGKVSHPLRVAGQGALGAASEAGGQALGEAAPWIGNKLSKVSNEMMANLVGVARRGALGQKPTFKGAVDIGKTVNDAINGGMSLEQIAGQIKSVRDTFNQATEPLLSHIPENYLVRIRSMLESNQDKAIEGSLNEAAHKNIQKLRSSLEAEFPKEISAQDAIGLRRRLRIEKNSSGERIWPAGTKTFREHLYNDLNNSLEKGMPPEIGQEFRANNQRISRLIKADDALDKKRLYGLGRNAESKSTYQAIANKIPLTTLTRSATLKTLKGLGSAAPEIGKAARVGVPVATRGVASALQVVGQGQDEE